MKLLLLFLDCQKGCSFDGCNDNNDVENGFTKYEPDGVTPREITCFEYSSFHDFSMEEDFPLDGSEYTDSAIRQCPAFANNGCFMASMVTYDGGKEAWGPNSFNKGCSMLDLGDMELDCIENPDVGYQSCKCESNSVIRNFGGFLGIVTV